MCIKIRRILLADHTHSYTGWTKQIHLWSGQWYDVNRCTVATGCVVKNRRVLIIWSCTHAMWTIKHATLFMIITPAFLGRFLYCLYRWKQEGILYKQVNKIYHFTLSVSPHYLVKLKRCMNSTFWCQSSQCVRSNWSFTAFTESHPIFSFSNFWNVFISLLAENFHIPTDFIQILSLSLNSTYLIFQTNCMK